MPATALTKPRPNPLAPHGALHSVQGINSRLDDLKLRGERLEGIIGAIAAAKLERKINGASVIEVTVYDPVGRLLRSPLLEEAHEIVVDGLHWRLVKVSSEGLNAPLVLTYEPLIVYLLKRIHGPHKAFRDKVTRAEFAKARFLEGANPRAALKTVAYENEKHAKDNPNAPRGQVVPFARFISPELHDVQPVASSKEAAEQKEERLATRNKGIGVSTGDLTVKGQAATKQQIANGEEVMEIAVSKSAPFRVCVALMEAVIVETLIGTYGPGRSNILEGEGAGVGAPIGSVVDEVSGFLTNKPAWTGEGAIAYYEKHPQAKAYEIAQATQASGAGKATNGKANYGAVEEEARKWVEAFGTGEGADSVTRFVKYAFDQKEKESNWACMNRLASEVHWRCFESANWVYFLEDATLLESAVRLQVSDGGGGIVDTTFDYDVGKEINEMTVIADAKTWAAPPGTVVSVHRHGPADGLYLVESIISELENHTDNVEIMLRRPREPLPEPSPKAESISVGNPHAGKLVPAGMPSNVVKMLEEAEAIEGTPYLWAAGHESVDAVKHRLSKYDCSGAVSRILYVGGYLNQPEASGALESWGLPGGGQWFTIFANAEHVFMAFHTTEGWKQWEEGGQLSDHAGWTTRSASGFVARHGKGG